MRQGGVEVGRLRVHGDAEPLRLRLGVERVLGAADLVGTRLPPAAVLVVRTLHDPMPGRLDVSRAGPDRDWEQRVRDDLDDLVLRAARPASAPADPGAPAVVFADRAELLACAWRELRHTGRASSWWWRALRIDDLPRLLLALAEAAYAVPAVVMSLEESGELEGCAALLGEVAAESVALQVARVFGRPGLVAEVRQRLVAASPPSVGSSAGARPIDAGARFGGAAPALPAGPAALSRAVMVEVCRALAAPAPSRPHPVVAARAPARPPTGRSAVPPGGTRPRPAPGRVETHPSAPAATTPRRGTVARPGTPEAEGRRGLPVRGRVPSPRRGAGAPAPARGSGSAVPEHPEARVAIEERPVPVGEESELVVDTSLGGVFHLVQVGQALGLHGDFTSPVATGIRLGLWDFVTLAARGLEVGSRADPVWGLLAELQGRDPARRPGVGFRPPRVWRTPRGWLAPLDAPGPWRWRDDGSRQALLHPAGFVVVEGASLDRGRECARYAVARCLDADPAAYDGSARDRWVAHLSGYLRVRLASALGVRPSRAGRTLCRRPARVHVTPTRVDVVSELADLPIEVRRAGLDRDLGFVPAAGRTIGFVFR